MVRSAEPNLKPKFCGLQPWYFQIIELFAIRWLPWRMRNFCTFAAVLAAAVSRLCKHGILVYICFCDFECSPTHAHTHLHTYIYLCMSCKQSKANKCKVSSFVIVVVVVAQF